MRSRPQKRQSRGKGPGFIMRADIKAGATSSLRSALTRLEARVGLADHKHFATPTHDLAVAVTCLCRLQRGQDLHGLHLIRQHQAGNYSGVVSGVASQMPKPVCESDLSTTESAGADLCVRPRWARDSTLARNPIPAPDGKPAGVHAGSPLRIRYSRLVRADRCFGLD